MIWWKPQNGHIMCTPGKLETVDREIERLNVSYLIVLEMCWTGKGQFIMDNGSTVVFSAWVQ